MNTSSSHRSTPALQRLQRWALPALLAAAWLPAAHGADTATTLLQEVDARTAAIEPKLIAWRRDIHQHPELGNREFRTSKLIAEHLQKLGLQVQTQVAHTGVVGILTGGLPGPVIALRADIDALPITEAVDLPFASKVRTEYNGQEVGVMHACGHDGHTASLMAVAEVLSGLRDQLPGTIKFIFQPAEEGTPRGEEGGAALMVKQGVLNDPRPEAIFAIHYNSGLHTGQVLYQPGPSNASTDNFFIKVIGKQTHAARPWQGVDPIVVASQVVQGIQGIVSRQISMGEGPTLITVGTIHGGVRTNIVPAEVELSGTIRSYQNEATRTEIHERLTRTAQHIATSAGAQAEVVIEHGYPSKINNPSLTDTAVPHLVRAFGQSNVKRQLSFSLSGEDFSFFANEIPGLQVRVGALPTDTHPAKAPPGHSPHFFLDEAALVVGARTYAHLALGYLLDARSQRDERAGNPLQ